MTVIQMRDKPTEEKFENQIGHTAALKYKGLHRCESGLKGGRCLGSHKSEYTPKCSCSYRWQAVHRAQHEDRKVYRKVVVKGSVPFKNASSPWPNEAHHLIPKAQLVNVICSIATGAEDKVDLRIMQHLLENYYNINHHRNMMVLPQQADMATRIGLPTHPAFKFLHKNLHWLQR
jgi:hypothetical protein